MQLVGLIHLVSCNTTVRARSHSLLPPLFMATNINSVHYLMSLLWSQPANVMVSVVADELLPILHLFSTFNTILMAMEILDSGFIIEIRSHSSKPNRNYSTISYG